MHELVSVIIPVYNGEKYIIQTLESVLNQTYQNLEILIINDGSTDNTLKLLETVKSEKITIINQENKGVSYAKQVGLNNAKGHFIQYLDADDLLSLDKIEVQINALKQHPNSIAVCSTIHFFDHENHLNNVPSEYEDKFLYSTDSPADFLINLYGGNGNGGSMIQPNAFLTPISIINKMGGWDISISPCPDEDGEYFCRAILASEGIVYTSNTYNYYRKFIKKNSLSALKDRPATERLFKSILLKKEHLFKHKQTEQAKYAIAQQLISLAVETYPKYPSLSENIIEEINKIGTYSFLPISGGPMIQKLSKFIGWRLARKIQYKINKK